MADIMDMARMACNSFSNALSFLLPVFCFNFVLCFSLLVLSALAVALYTAVKSLLGSVLCFVKKIKRKVRKNERGRI